MPTQKIIELKKTNAQNFMPTHKTHFHFFATHKTIPKKNERVFSPTHQNFYDI